MLCGSPTLGLHRAQMAFMFTEFIFSWFRDGGANSASLALPTTFLKRTIASSKKFRRAVISILRCGKNVVKEKCNLGKSSSAQRLAISFQRFESKSDSTKRLLLLFCSPPFRKIRKDGAIINLHRAKMPAGTFHFAFFVGEPQSRFFLKFGLSHELENELAAIIVADNACHKIKLI